MSYRIIPTSAADFAPCTLELLEESLTRTTRERGACTVGLSGGSTPRPIYAALGAMSLDWSKVSVFLVDERYVPPDNPESNQHMVRETLLTHAAIPPTQVMFPDTLLPMEECVSTYADTLRALFSDALPDLVILGMGDDGHIASLFPPLSPEALGDQHFTLHTVTDRFAVHDRISLALNAIAAAQEHVLLLRGEEKRRTWETMLASDEDEERWPLKRILETGNVTVLADWK
ncbi:6-phosphogluconolactonase [Candidatus Peregrinibacteria bacterium CG10_big_fil_rev_8_21_14_0_10_55_24]|nr:MAG: 6-phosphogluconolactonase [Candidatus Peregrinibacteria bacterium CG10_big_fil_rev_8_21_14_0_10_55_24]